jgi:hypothetical protein
VYWGPFLDAQPRSLTYVVTPPAGAAGTANFQGLAAFDGHQVSIVGQRQATVVPVFGGSVVCTLPDSYTAAVPFVVTDLATPPTNNLAYDVADTLPAGWVAANISHDGIFDSDGSVRWGPFFDNLSRSLSYTVIPAAQTTGVAVFAGTASFGTNVVAITGQRQCAPAAAQPRITLVRPVVTNGRFQFDFTNTTGLPVTLYATTNQALPLSQWETLSAPQDLGGGLYRFTDPDTANHPQRFFQIR